MSTRNKPCRSEPSYNFYECVESYYYKKRGCQFPWNTYVDLKLQTCSNIPLLVDLLEQSANNRSMGGDREWYTNFERTVNTGGECPPPCNITTYELDYIPTLPNGDNIVVDIAFKNFVFRHQHEFFACDKTCIIGELGGNLGFFLGASVLLVLDLLFEAFAVIVSKILHRSIKCK